MGHDDGGEQSQKPDAALQQNPETDAAADQLSEDTVEQDKRPDPTRYGDWEKAGRCIDF